MRQLLLLFLLPTVLAAEPEASLRSSPAVELNQKADDLPANAFPQVLEVDYVRVYQWAD